MNDCSDGRTRIESSWHRSQRWLPSQPGRGFQPRPGVFVSVGAIPRPTIKSYPKTIRHSIGYPKNLRKFSGPVFSRPNRVRRGPLDTQKICPGYVARYNPRGGIGASSSSRRYVAGEFGHGCGNNGEKEARPREAAVRYPARDNHRVEGSPGIQDVVGRVRRALRAKPGGHGWAGAPLLRPASRLSLPAESLSPRPHFRESAFLLWRISAKAQPQLLTMEVIVVRGDDAGCSAALDDR